MSASPECVRLEEDAWAGIDDLHAFSDPSIKNAWELIISSGGVESARDEDVISWLEEVFQAGLEKGRQEAVASDKNVVSSDVRQ